jgi:hypothetical protein
MQWLGSVFRVNRELATTERYLHGKRKALLRYALEVSDHRFRGKFQQNYPLACRKNETISKIRGPHRTLTLLAAASCSRQTTLAYFSNILNCPPAAATCSNLINKLSSVIGDDAMHRGWLTILLITMIK